MPETTYRGRRAWVKSNGRLEMIVTVEGGHVASLVEPSTGINPLWSPPWESMEPSQYRAGIHTQYGNDAESRLLAGILGHNLCLDVFGGPSEAEAAAGMTVHGEASVMPYAVSEEGDTLVLRGTLEQAQLGFERRLRLREASDVVEITETVENLLAWDRPSAWTQHVTLGPPFIERGKTQFRAPATRSKVIEFDFTGGKGAQRVGAEFDWPFCPRRDGGEIDLRVFSNDPVSAGFTTHLMDPKRPQAYFLAWHPGFRLLTGYVWKQSDFPWLGRWEENHCRTNPPWNGQTVTLGMEFGASPMPESRRQMIERGSLFGVPGYRWLPARSRVSVSYCAFVRVADAIPERVAWDGEAGLRFTG